MSKLAKVNQFNRSGTVHYRVDQRENGIAGIMLSVDFDRAPVPENNYIADYFELHRCDADVLMIFGKKNFPSESELRNKIEIYFPFDPFVNQLWKSSRLMHKLLRENFEQKGKKAKEPGDLTSAEAKVQTLTANNALVVMTAGQCVMDFFLINAKDLWLKTRKGDPLNVDAIVRVFMSEHILLGFLNRCDELAAELKDEFDVQLSEEDDEILESSGL